MRDSARIPESAVLVLALSAWPLAAQRPVAGRVGDLPSRAAAERESTARRRALLSLHETRASGGMRLSDRRVRADTTGAELFEIGCASCHGMDGKGAGPGRVAFEIPLPDFTDCSFASREPLADWLAIVHAGGPVRGFDTTMPAFGEAFSNEQILSILEHVRTFCPEPSWPRGELNLPRAMVTEKAYPEDEAVSTLSVDYDGPGSVMNEIVYERRFGVRNQWELKIPFGAVETGAGGDWQGGLGDIEVGLKRTMWHSLASGSIFALGVDAGLPTGRESVGLGKGTVVFEPYTSFGQIIAENGFFQFQGAVEVPVEEKPGAEKEGLWRGVLGWTLMQNGGLGRSWTPMLEVLGSRELEGGGGTAWDLIPQIQVSINTRQHLLANIGVRLPLSDSGSRSSTFLFYILWDWFDGGFFDGW